jgi:hypothetical protein
MPVNIDHQGLRSIMGEKEWGRPSQMLKRLEGAREKIGLRKKSPDTKKALGVTRGQALLPHSRVGDFFPRQPTPINGYPIKRGGGWGPLLSLTAH